MIARPYRAKVWVVASKRLKSGERRRNVVIHSPELGELLRALRESGVRQVLALVDVPNWGVIPVKCSIVRLYPPYGGYGLYPLMSEPNGLLFHRVFNLLRGAGHRALEVVVKAVEPL